MVVLSSIYALHNRAMQIGMQNFVVISLPLDTWNRIDPNDRRGLQSSLSALQLKSAKVMQVQLRQLSYCEQTFVFCHYYNFIMCRHITYTPHWDCSFLRLRENRNFVY